LINLTTKTYNISIVVHGSQIRHLQQPDVPDRVSGSVFVGARRAKTAKPRAPVRMDYSFVCPGFGIGLALNDKDIAANQVFGLVQNSLAVATLDSKLGAIRDGSRFQFCRKSNVGHAVHDAMRCGSNSTHQQFLHGKLHSGMRSMPYILTLAPVCLKWREKSGTRGAN